MPIPYPLASRGGYGHLFFPFCSLVRTFITPAIVLHRTRYNDRYSIYHLYTLGRGRVGVLVPERTNKRNPLRELFRPLSELDVTLEDNPKKELLRVQEARIIDPHHAVYLDAVKAAQAMFLSEFLYRVCLSPEVDSDLYRFLSYTLTLWDQSQRSVANFHLCFLLRLLDVLGIAPYLPPPPLEPLPFCLLDHVYTEAPRGVSLTAEQAQHLSPFSRMTFANMHCFRYHRGQRQLILDRLLDYYRLHLHDFPPLKCLPILRQLGEEELRGQILALDGME